MGGAIKWISNQLAQGVVQAVVVSLITAIAPIWAIFGGAPGYLIFTLAAVTLAASLVIVQALRTLLQSANNTAFLRLQTYGDARFPFLLVGDNIFRFFYMRNGVTFMQPGGGAVTAETATLYIAFQDNVRIKTLEITSPDFKLPQHETKEYNQRYAIVFFSEPLPMGILEVEAGF